MRLTIALDDDLHALVKEMAAAQSRTITGQIAHLCRTNPETMGWRAFKSHPGFQSRIGARADALEKGE